MRRESARRLIRGGAAHFRAAIEQNRSGHKSVAVASDVAHMHEDDRDIEQAGESQRHAVEERQLAGPTSETPVKENRPIDSQQTNPQGPETKSTTIRQSNSVYDLGSSS